MISRASAESVAKNRDPNKYYVLVSRWYPRAFRMRGLKTEQAVDVWDRSLAPSKELLNDFKGRGDWIRYMEKFAKEIPEHHIINVTAQHLRDANGKPLVFVCIEKDEEYPRCHTWLILDVLKNRFAGVKT